MGIRKRGSVWHIDIVAPNGERIRRSAETEDKRQALELHDKLKSEAWRQSKLGETPTRIWQDAAVRWLKEQAHKASIDEDRAKLRWLDRYLAGMELKNITRAVIDRITEAKLAEKCSDATVNRTLALIRGILRKCAREWEWIDKAPTIRLLKEPSRRIRFLTQEQAQRLLAELPEHLREMATFTLATGLRRSNVTGLTWQQIDLNRKMAWVHPDQAKARRAIPVPLNDAAMEVLKRQAGRHASRVFSYEGRPITQCSTAAWYKALKRAGIEGLRWHDLRHSWASTHVINGTPLFALQELAGWESEKMVRRYAHLSAEHLAKYVGNVEVTNLAQEAKPEKLNGANRLMTNGGVGAD